MLALVSEDCGIESQFIDAGKCISILSNRFKRSTSYVLFRVIKGSVNLTRTHRDNKVGNLIIKK